MIASGSAATTLEATVEDHLATCSHSFDMVHFGTVFPTTPVSFYMSSVASNRPICQLQNHHGAPTFLKSSLYPPHIDRVEPCECARLNQYHTWEPKMHSHVLASKSRTQHIAAMPVAKSSDCHSEITPLDKKSCSFAADKIQ